MKTTYVWNDNQFKSKRALEQAIATECAGFLTDADAGLVEEKGKPDKPAHCIRVRAILLDGSPTPDPRRRRRVWVPRVWGLKGLRYDFAFIKLTKREANKECGFPLFGTKVKPRKAYICW